ncbi:MAG: AAA family ATPase, partial [Rhodothalassiaceae bacterium]
MQFTRLRLSGFKSFVDPTELHIEPGLTGIVGPNGCGKSNLVEALRWVMGENSPKSMRGEGMDDVIFAGTGQRPPRNLAEVSLLIDNGARNAPAAFNDEAVIEVTRRIERESGSAYRINGRDVRAKDVQLLFADAATGAHSPALVSQGRIAALIAAKPENRRAILEEAAGISGLHSRRKEAEQRLRAAERNLERLDDVLGQLQAQADGLRRQARQARRYRALSGHLRRTEAGILYTRWKAAAEETMRLEGALREAERLVAAETAAQAALSKEQAELAAGLPARRQAEAEASARVQRLVLARESLEAEERRRKETLEKLAQQLKEIAADAEREAERRDDAAAALERLASERTRLEADTAREREAEAEARSTLDAAAAAANEAEAAFDTLNQRLIEARGRRASLSSDEAAIARRMDRLRLDREDAARDLAALGQEEPQAQALSEAE